MDCSAVVTSSTVTTWNWVRVTADVEDLIVGDGATAAPLIHPDLLMIHEFF